MSLLMYHIWIAIPKAGNGELVFFVFFIDLINLICRFIKIRIFVSAKWNRRQCGKLICTIQCQLSDFPPVWFNSLNKCRRGRDPSTGFIGDCILGKTSRLCVIVFFRPGKYMIGNCLSVSNGGLEYIFWYTFFFE